VGKPTGFLETDRQAGVKRQIKERIKDYKEFESNLSNDELEVQAGSHGAGQTRPVNSGKLLVECNSANARFQWPL